VASSLSLFQAFNEEGEFEIQDDGLTAEKGIKASQPRASNVAAV
jgi:hypothetical protein